MTQALSNVSRIKPVRYVSIQGGRGGNGGFPYKRSGMLDSPFLGSISTSLSQIRFTSAGFFHKQRLVIKSTPFWSVLKQSSNHTQIDLLYEVNWNLPMSISDLFIWEFPTPGVSIGDFPTLGVSIGEFPTPGVSIWEFPTPGVSIGYFELPFPDSVTLFPYKSAL